jgi:transcriptional regulator with XRE-family HTH domain
MVADVALVAYTASMLTPGQIRAARSLLGWKQTDLAERSGVSEISIKNIERGVTDARGSTLIKLQSAFESAGLQFLDPGAASFDGGHGVRFKQKGPA